MKKLVLFFILASSSWAGGNNDLFSEIIYRMDEADSSGIDKLCVEAKTSFEPHSFLCAYLNRSDEYFINHLSQAAKNNSLQGLWEIDKLIYSNKALMEVKVIKDNPDIFGKILSRVFDSFEIGTIDNGVKCDALKGLYYNSDGYFNEEIYVMISQNIDKREVLACVQLQLPRYMNDKKEMESE